MNLIEKQYKKIKAAKRLGIMTHVVAGYPNLEATRELILMMVGEGVDFIELQIPFSDPVGDGPVIRGANTAALEHGMKVAATFELVRRLKQKDHVAIPLLFMTYLNIPYAYGLEKFCVATAAAGISGLIIPDYNLDMESHEHFNALCEKNNLILQRYAAFDSGADRLKDQAKGAQGFIYCFSTRGVTGTRQELDPELVQHLKKLRTIFSQPLAVGFGISKAENVKALQGHADIAIVGSAMIKAYDEKGLEGAREKTQELVGAL